MVVHVPMAVHPNVKKVLVIGGGDGGVARELGHYQEIEEIDVVEPDKVFVEVCKKFFPDNACGLEDKRVRIFYEDGLKFLRLKQNEYDLIINDAIDPLGHNAGPVSYTHLSDFDGICTDCRTSGSLWTLWFGLSDFIFCTVFYFKTVYLWCRCCTGSDCGSSTCFTWD